MTVGVPFSNGATCMCAASTDRPRNITPSSVPMITSVVRAFFHAGLRNAGTPLEMASTPVTAAPPDANACRTTNSDGAEEEPVAAASPNVHHPGVVVLGAVGSEPVSDLSTPEPSSTTMLTMKK